MAATGGACLKLHANPDACFGLDDKKYIKNLEESAGWMYDGDSQQIMYNPDEEEKLCIWPQYGVAMSGSKVVGGNCDSSKTDKKWQLVPLEGDHEDYYQIRHKDSKRCLSLKNKTGVLDKCNSGDGKQHWRFDGIGSEY